DALRLGHDAPLDHPACGRVLGDLAAEEEESIDFDCLGKWADGRRDFRRRNCGLAHDTLLRRMSLFLHDSAIPPSLRSFVWRSRWRQAELFREKAKLGACVAHALTEGRIDTMPFAAACDQQDRPGRGVGLLQRRGKLARLP